MNYMIVDAEAEHVKMLCASLRSDDLDEISRFGVSPRRGLWRSFRVSLLRRAAFVDGEIAAMWGVGGTVLGSEGIVWLMTSDAIERAPFAFVREARSEVATMLQIWPRLVGMVSPDYARAVKFLSLLGFSIIPNGSLSLFSKER